MSQFKAPVYRAPGNHDIWSDLSETIFSERYSPPYYSFDFENIHFIILYNSRLATAGSWPDDQLAWLEKDLKTHSDAVYTLVFAHKPFWFEMIGINQPDTLHRLFVEHGVDVGNAICVYALVKSPRNKGSRKHCNNLQKLKHGVPLLMIFELF